MSRELGSRIGTTTHSPDPREWVIRPMPVSAARNEVVLERVRGGPGTRGNADFAEDVRKVPSDGLVAQKELSGHLLVGLTG
jgi:hypothetical protein